MQRLAERGFTGFTFCAQYWCMQDALPLSGIGSIFAVLAKLSKRPRYAFLVLQLVVEAADQQGRAGPLIQKGMATSYLRDWLCVQLMSLSERDGRRAALRERVASSVQHRLNGEPGYDEAIIDEAVEEQVLTVGRANVSRAISDLVKAGFLSRHYAGYATNHANRGGRRHAVYVVDRSILAAFGKVAAPFAPPQSARPMQGQLFAA